MDYLRNIGSAAASSLLQKSGIVHSFILGERVASFDGKSIWTLHDAVKRDDSSLISVFVFDGSLPQSKGRLALAKNATKKLKTIRHPHVLKFVDSFETESSVYLATERIRPLSLVMDEEKFESTAQREQWLIWGMERITSTAIFLNETVGAIHGNLRTQSIFVSRIGEWQLGGFEILTVANSEDTVLYSLAGLLPDAQLVASPEIKTGGWEELRNTERGTSDAYCIGLLLHFLFNPKLPPPAASIVPFPLPGPSAKGSIPAALFTVYKKLLHPKPSSRLKLKDFHRLGMEASGGDGSGFFANNNLVRICNHLDGLPLASDAGKLELLRLIESSASNLPPTFCAYRVVPSLMGTLNQGGSTVSAVLPAAFKLARSLPPAEYLSVVIMPAIKLFPNQDRTVRMALLDALPEFIEKVDDKLVSEQIWPHLQGGFADTVPIVREATVRSILHIHPKLSDRILNNELLRYLAKMQSDLEASIRTNTCILIGRLAPSLGINTRRKVLAPAFAKALRDGFVHARVAGLAAFLANLEYFEPEDISLKVLPVLVTVLTDKEKIVRDQAFKTVQAYLKKLEVYVSTLPETADPNGEVQKGATQRDAMTSSLANSAAGAAGALAGWTWTSIGKRIANGDVSSSAAVSGSINRSISPGAPLISFDHNTSTPKVAHGGRALQLPQSSINNVSDIMEQLQTEMEISPPRPTELDDWGSFEVVTPENAQVPTFNSDSTRSQTVFNTGKTNQMAANREHLQATPKLLHSKTSSLVPVLEALPSPPLPAASPSPTPLGKEEKLAEIARRKEERRQRIANLKQQNSTNKG